MRARENEESGKGKGECEKNIEKQDVKRER